VIENQTDALFIIHSYRKQQADEQPIALDRYASWNAGSRQEAMTGGRRDLGSFNPINLNIDGQHYAGIRNEFSARLLHVEVPHRSDYFLLHSDQRVAYASSQAPSAQTQELAADFALLLGSIRLE
jgi:hypothetical protein